MDPITIFFLALLSAGATVAVIVVVALAIGAVRDHLREKRSQSTIGNKDVAVLLKERMANGNYHVVAGFWDGEELKERQDWEAEKLDSELARLPDGKAVVLT